MRTRPSIGAWIVLFLTAAPLTARADQFVLFDATFTYTWDDAMNSSPSKSHYYVTPNNWLNKARPTNWQAPVDYRDGTVHIHLEVLEKPAGTQMAGWALCYVGGNSYGCPYTPYYTQTGVYERDVDMHSFFNNATIDWTRGISEVDLVYTVNDSGSGHITNFPNLKDLVTPTRVRIAMVQVSQGSKYDPSILQGDGGVDAGGSKDAGAGDVSSPADASNGDAPASGSGGMGGTGGAPGTGGAGGDVATGSGGLGSGGSSAAGAAGEPTQGTGGGAGSTGTGRAGSSGAPDNMGSCNCSFASPRGSSAFRFAGGAVALFALARSRRRRRASLGQVVRARR